MASKFKRRFFLKSMAISGAFGVVFSSIQAMPQRLSLKRNSNFLITNINAAKRIGVAYFKKYPRKLNEELLLNELSISADQLNQILSGENTTWFRRWLKEKQQLDFKKNELISIEGWLLSKTEVQLCALFALKT